MINESIIKQTIQVDATSILTHCTKEKHFHLGMAPYDHPSAADATPVALSRRNGGGHNPNRNYRIAHQKVSIDVDLEERAIYGTTEIQITPLEQNLNFVKFDCRQMEITDVLVNSRRADYLHLDPLLDEFKEFTHQTENKSVITEIKQHQFYKNKFKKIFNGDNSEELTIFMPERLNLKPYDPSVSSAFTPSYRDSPGSHKPNTSSETTYTPVVIGIDFRVKNCQNGVHFVGGKGSKLNRTEWHAFTTNSNYGISTSSWVPCIDSLWEKCTWEVEISVPRTVKDIGVTKMIGSDTSTSNDDLEEEESIEIAVIGSDYANQKETAHKMDLSKKLVSYTIYNPTSAHHIGWSVGGFIQCPLINLQEEDQPDSLQEKDSTQVPSAVYCLPSRQTNAINSTIFLYKAIDFYSKEFGSFPYTSNALVFVSDIDSEYSGFGGITILNEKLLYSPREIEPLYPTTFTLSVVLAEQWSGINVVPKTYSDLWVTIGIAHFMAYQFIKNLMGLNEFKYRIKKQSDKICEEDIDKFPLANPFLNYPISTHDLDFIRLKAPIVLFILDRRMTKTDKSFGLYRVIPKIFLQAMSGDLPNGCLSTYNFQHVCEKVNHNRLDPFFRQWVYGSGVPIFRVTQRFNKKRMFIEMGIRQVQQQESPKYHPTSESFVKDAKQDMNKQEEVPIGEIQNFFTGPMTIRIHEADGTPYEHIVDLKEGFTKLDIQYNTKYKRLKRNKKKTDRQENGEEEENVLLHCLGDTLQSDKEVKDWDLIEWSKEEEDRMANEAFEWIRIDADFEWICKIYINQPDYMFASQLQQDRDIEAQIESVFYFANSNPSALYSTILLRTLMDSRYHYGVRVEAAIGLAKLSKPQSKWIGTSHLLKAFKNLFCFNHSSIPLPNNFVDYPTYYIKKSIPLALSRIKDQNNNVPIEIKTFLLNLLKFNENFNNPYTDSYYIGHLIQCIGSSLVANPLVEAVSQLTDVDRKFLKEAISEISRHQKMDEWVATNNNKIVTVALGEKLKLARKGLFEFEIEELLERTQPNFDDEIRVLAFDGLFSIGALKNKSILTYFFTLVSFEKSYTFKTDLIRLFIRCVGRAAIEGTSSELDESELDKAIELNFKKEEKKSNGNFVVVEEGSNDHFESRRDAVARATLKGSIELLRRDYAEYKPLVDLLWKTAKHPLLNLSQRRDLLDVVSVFIEAYDTMPVTFLIPREKKIAASNLGNGKVVLKREGQFKISLSKKLVLNSAVLSGIPLTKPTLGGTPISNKKSSIKINKPSPGRYKSEIRRSKSGPLRYVKISSSKRMIIVSSDPLRRSKKLNSNVSSTTTTPITKKPIVKIPSSRANHSSAGTPNTIKNEIIAITPNDTPKAPKLKLKFKF
ncbi:hypothetical protein WICMUC_003394 [Wickerhamomyces mucosus]|uniref:Transcription initiation factor TFIID subunit 2 n=1 Tax=Wickerhamomyces mucosus TaxID=1378264 RepID=A0A9P8PMR9_9ASCO|nr:hypothetical protein WICMUC_003394 [Wickerhamomyces mucosus]